MKKHALVDGIQEEFHDNDECTRVMCKNIPTMTLDLLVPLGADKQYIDHIPYCDDCLGFFYRSFMRKSYQVTVLDITVIQEIP